MSLLIFLESLHWAVELLPLSWQSALAVQIDTNIYIVTSRKCQSCLINHDDSSLAWADYHNKTPQTLSTSLIFSVYSSFFCQSFLPLSGAPCDNRILVFRFALASRLRLTVIITYWLFLVPRKSVLRACRADHLPTICLHLGYPECGS